jgi:small GTP-binding protein
VLLVLQLPDEARLAARRLAEERPTDRGVRCLLARALLACGDALDARDQLLRALEAIGEDQAREAAEVHQLLGRVHRAVDSPAQALQHLRIAQQLQQPPSAELLRESLTLQLELGEISSLTADARALRALEADDPLALAAAGIAQLDRDPEGAVELLARSLAAGETAAARLGLGLFHRRQGRPREALTALRAALRLRPESRRLRDELTTSYRDQLRLDETSGEADLYPTLRRLQLLLGARPLLEDLSLTLTRIRTDFDRPLLVAVMGEFNSGKSTFVNALIGEEIAPMGVTPTTATINLLKYGEQRGARVIWRDDREQQLAWEEVGPFLRQLQQEGARAVRVVELLYPAEELLRVNVVDTPGLNSMIAEHEQTAREYLAQADAVIWLFSADQAGKQTEQQALETIAQQRLKTVAVLNKVDRLDPTQLEQLTGHLRQGFAPLVEGLIAVSARHALQALVADDPQALEQSRFPELRRFLEQQLFSRSRRIKREVASQRLVQVIAAARERAAAELTPVEGALQIVQQAIDDERRVRNDDQRDAERRQLRRAIDRVYLAAADEVLDFVRPRRWFFGEHRATRADRDFLAELLEERLEGVGQRSFDRIAGALAQRGARLRSTLSAALANGTLQALDPHLVELDQRLEQRIELLRQQVYARFTAFSRGFLCGGRVDHFFNVQLPGLALETDAVHRALTAQVVDLEAELVAPLAAWLEATSATLIARLERLRDELALIALDLDAGLRQPLEQLAAQLQVPPAPAPPR